MKFSYSGNVAALPVQLEAAFEVLSEETDYYVNAGYNALHVFIEFPGQCNDGRYNLATIYVHNSDIGICKNDNRGVWPGCRFIIPIGDGDCFEKMVALLKGWADEQWQHLHLLQQEGTGQESRNQEITR